MGKTIVSSEYQEDSNFFANKFENFKQQVRKPPKGAAMLPNTKQRTFLLWVNVICLTLPNVFGKSIDYDEGCVIEYDIYYEGDKITQKTTKNLQECVERSVSIPGGLFWTWHEDTKHCFIKGEVSGKIKYCGVKIQPKRDKRSSLCSVEEAQFLLV